MPLKVHFSCTAALTLQIYRKYLVGSYKTPAYVFSVHQSVELAVLSFFSLYSYLSYCCSE